MNLSRNLSLFLKLTFLRSIVRGKSREMKAMTKDRSWSSEISFIIAHSKVATCRYNQELSSENNQHERPRCNEQDVEKDESSNDEEDTVEAANKSDNEYEEVILGADDPPSLTNTLSLANYEKETTSDLPETPNACKLGMFQLI